MASVSRWGRCPGVQVPHGDERGGSAITACAHVDISAAGDADDDVEAVLAVDGVNVSGVACIPYAPGVVPGVDSGSRTFAGPAVHDTREEVLEVF